MAMVLLNYDCDKIIDMTNEGKVIPFTLSIIWKMARLKNGEFYRTYRRNQIKKAYEYMHSMSGIPIPLSLSHVAFEVLERKLKSNSNDAHESIIFSKYIELKNCSKVAEHFGIPHLHVSQVIKKTKDELKKEISKSL
jgi:hypothetical protein